MRLTTAWSQVVTQNVVLRFSLLLVTACLGVMTFVAAKIALRDPMVVERSCFTTTLESKPVAATATEVESFIKEVIHQRFDSSATPSGDMMGLDEFKYRTKEQDEFSRRQIKQKIVVNRVTRKDDQVLVDADRIISVGTVRSAFTFSVVVNLSSVKRSSSNPYGLVATKFAQNSEQKEESKQ